jgi:hypothetical protein
MATSQSSHLQQARFFQLPREIRDLIYEYYVSEERGYQYGFDAGKMRRRTPAHSAASPVESAATGSGHLSLMLTCKQAAEEMEGVALRHNTLTFTAASSEREQVEYQGLRSKAGRFHCLLLYVQLAKMEMLRQAARCITEEILSQITERYPAAGGWFGHPLQRNPLSRRRDGWAPHHWSRSSILSDYQTLSNFTVGLI